MFENNRKITVKKVKKRGTKNNADGNEQAELQFDITGFTGYQEEGMTLTQMSDFITRDDSALNMKMNKMAQDLDAHRDQLQTYEHKIVESASSKTTTADAQSSSGKEEFAKVK